jgi:2,4-dienoyl-CoA reductase-like NADH-dependent reductase (Old Yellow Enzyme family)
MIILESAAVDALEGGTGLNLRLDQDKDEGTAAFRELISQLHSRGTRLVAQLWHAGPRAHIKDGLPISPSGTTPGFPGSRALAIIEMENLVQRFVKAGERAANIGFDAVEIHAAHGYLLHHFIDKVTNRRKDLYGGSIEGRYRILKEICRGIKSKHPGLPVLLRISLQEDEDFPAIAGIIQEAGFDAVDLRTGFSSNAKITGSPAASTAYILNLVRKLRPHLDIPLMAGGRILMPEQAERAISRHGVDAVVLGRPLLADPDWAKKALAGQPVNPCIYDCEPSCYSNFKQGNTLNCVYYQRKE